MFGAFDPSRVFHWGYVVPNMERAVKTWVAQGAELVVPPAVDPIQNVSCCLLVFMNAVAIELVAPQPQGPNPVETRLKKGGGLDHVCLFTDDIASDLKTLEEQGGVVVVPPCYGAVFDRRLAFVTTRGGLVVELMTSKPEGKLAADPLAAFLKAAAKAPAGRGS